MYIYILNLNHVFSFFFRISLEPLPSLQHHVLLSPEVLPLQPHVAGIEIVPRHQPRLSCTDLAVQNTSAVLLVQSEACRQGFVTFGESSASYFPTTRFDDLRTRVACQSWQVPLTAHYDIHGACLAKHSVSVQLLQILQCNIKTALIQTESNFELRQKSRVTDLPKTWHMPSQVRRHVFNFFQMSTLFDTLAILEVPLEFSGLDVSQELGDLLLASLSHRRAEGWGMTTQKKRHNGTPQKWQYSVVLPVKQQKAECKAKS